MFNFKDDDEEHQIFLGNAGGSDEPELEEPELDIPDKPSAGQVIARQARDAQNQKLGVNLAGAVGDILGSGQGFGNFYLGKMNPQSNAASNFAGKVAAGIEDPFERREKAAKYMEMRRKEMQARSGGDANSPDSLAMQEQIGTLFPQLKSVVQNKSKEQISQMLPLLAKKIEGDVSRENARIAAGNRSQERQDKMDEARRKEAMLDDKQVNAITDLENAESDLNNLLTSLGDKSNWTGLVDGATPDMLVGEDQVAWRSALGKYKDAYRKAITGAGAGNDEIARLEKRLPSEYDTHANFKSKANEALKEIARRKQTLLGNYGKMGKDVAKYSAGPKKTIVKRFNGSDGSQKLVYNDGSEEIIPATAGR